MMKINEFIKNNLKVTNLAKNIDPLMKHLTTSSRLPQIVCSDGFTMSVQVGFSLYSTPKKVAKRYSAVEIGFPSDHESLIEEYAETFYKDVKQTYIRIKVNRFTTTIMWIRQIMERKKF